MEEGSIGYYAGAICLLLVTSALFSCFETAIVGSSRARAHRLKS